MEVAVGVEPLVHHYGVGALLERHVVRQIVSQPFEGVCHGCGADVDIAPFLRDDELPLLAGLDAPDEATSLRAWTRLLDGEPWLCRTCLLLLP